jgi:hypothetical protein
LYPHFWQEQWIFKKNKNLELFKIELNSGTPHKKTWNLFIVCVPEPNFGTPPAASAMTGHNPTTYPQTTLNQGVR